MGCRRFGIVRVGDDLEFRSCASSYAPSDLIADVDGQSGIDQCGRVAPEELDDGPPVRGF